MIACNFFEFIDELLSSSRPCSDFDAYPVSLSDSVMDNYVELSSYCSLDDFLADSSSYVLMRNFLEEIEKNRQKICYLFIVLGRRFSTSRVYSCLYRSMYVRCIVFENCDFSLVMMTTIPRKK